MNHNVRWDWLLRKKLSHTQLKRDFLNWVTLYCMCPGDIIIRTTWPVTKESLFKSGPNMDEIECLSTSPRFVAHGVTVQVTARNTGTVIIIARVARGVMDQEEECKYHELTMYSWTSLQWPPWGSPSPRRRKWPLLRGGRCREVLNKSQCMDFLSAGTKKK